MNTEIEAMILQVSAQLQEVLKRAEADESLLRQALVALTYHEAMTRPVASTTKTVAALRRRLGVKD